MREFICEEAPMTKIDGTVVGVAMVKRKELVRCVDCKRRGTYDCPVYVGGDGMYSEPDDWFCADGEK